MKTKIQVEQQVEDFIKSLAPEPRRKLRLAIKALEQHRGNIKPLEGNLAGYHRLRVSGYRVIFKERSRSGRRIIDCIFIERRSVVYEILANLLAEEMTK